MSDKFTAEFTVAGNKYDAARLESAKYGLGKNIVEYLLDQSDKPCAFRVSDKIGGNTRRLQVTIIPVDVNPIDPKDKIISDLRQLISDLKEDGERLAKIMSCDSTGTCWCGYPDFRDSHKPDCPITLHADLMERIEGI